uniref:Carbonyl reductase [NADPH] 1 n=2 Tax=Cacopsylla melanoneura TaxID=428564 RepID=A0A8D8M1C7_9HEMI
MWLPGPSVAIVTGASTGIGFTVVRDMVRFFDGTVYLTCRNETAGRAAVDEIKHIYDNETIPTRRYYQEKIKFYKVDVSDYMDVVNFTQHVTKVHGGVDILVNNAAVHLDMAGHLTKEEKVNRIFPSSPAPCTPLHHLAGQTNHGHELLWFAAHVSLLVPPAPA